MAVKLREYQSEALARARELYDSGINRTLLVLATGLGKTITFAMLPSVFPELAVRGTLVLVHREELVNQAVEKLSFVNPRLTIGVEKAELHADISSDVVVASVQTLGSASGKRLRKLLASMEFGIVIIDEAHHVTAGSQYDRILNELGLGSLINESDQIRSGQQRLLVGVTATPNRHDNVGLSTFFNEILLNYGLQEAVQNGYLTDIRHIKVHTSANLEGLKNYRGDFSITDLSEATNTPERNQEIVSAYLKHGDSKSAVAFCSSVAHAYDLRDMFRLAGVSAEAIDGNTPKDQRKEILRRHESGELSIVTNFGVLTEGYDGMIHIVLMCRPTKSASLYMQMIGRGVRTIPSDLGNIPTKAGRLKAIEASVKPDCIVLDFVDNRHDVVTTPSLFGLPVNFDSQGSRLCGVTMKKFNDAIKKNPMNVDGILKAESFEEIDVQTEVLNVWATSNGSDAIKEMARYKWMRVGTDAYQIDLQTESKGNFTIRVQEDYLGKTNMTLITPPKRRPDGGWVSTSAQHVETYPSLETAIRAAEGTIDTRYPEARSNVDPEARWRRGEPTVGQVNMLRAYGIDHTKVENKGQAGDLISAAKALRYKFDSSLYTSLRDGVVM